MIRFGIAPILLLALAFAGCEDTAGRSSGGDGPFPSCTPAPAAMTDTPPEGLRAPPGAVLTSARPSGQRLIIVKGYVESDPIAIEKHYRSLKRQKGYEFFLLENEVVEAEAFFTDGEWRNYVTARTECEGRSQLHIVVAPEDYGKK